MGFTLILLVCFTIGEIICCNKSIDIQERKLQKIKIEKLINAIESLETKIDNLIKKEDSSLSNPATGTQIDTLKMTSKADCTQEAIGNRKVACKDLDKIESCTCKNGKQFKKDDDYKESCKVDFCNCLDGSLVHLFGLHRNLLNCIII